MIKLIKLRRNESGVTLIELLIVMGLLSIFMVIIATIFTSSVDVQEQSNSYSSTLINSRYIMARLNYDISRASSVNVPYSFGDDTNSLGLEIGGIDNTFSLSGTNLTLADNLGVDNLNDSDVMVSNLTFQKIGNQGGQPTILYNFTLSSVEQNHGVSDVETFSGGEGLNP